MSYGDDFDYGYEEETTHVNSIWQSRVLRIAAAVVLGLSIGGAYWFATKPPTEIVGLAAVHEKSEKKIILTVNTGSDRYDVSLKGVQFPGEKMICEGLEGGKTACRDKAEKIMENTFSSDPVVCVDNVWRESGGLESRCMVLDADIGLVLIQRGLALTVNAERPPEYQSAQEEACKTRQGLWKNVARNCTELGGY